MKQEKLLLPGVPPECVTGEKLDQTIEHQLLINWMSVHSGAITEANPILQVQFISSKSPFHLSAGRGSVLHDQVEFPDGNKMSFTPDAALCITHRGRGKSVLFFLEVDHGTERLVNSGGQSRQSEIRRKVVVYRCYLGRRGYKRYEQAHLFNAEFRGFRLLLVAHTEPRRATLCRLVTAMMSSDFVWVGSWPELRSQGMLGRVWNRGGREELFALLGPSASYATPPLGAVREEPIPEL